MNNQGKRDDQVRGALFGLFIGWMGILLFCLIAVLFCGCATKKYCEKTHVITEMDGDRVIRWYTCTPVKPGDVSSDIKWGDLKPIFKNNESKRTD